MRVQPVGQNLHALGVAVITCPVGVAVFPAALSIRVSLAFDIASEAIKARSP